MTVDAAWEFFADEPHLHRSLTIVREVGWAICGLANPRPSLSGGEAQRIKLATELQRIQRGDTLYVLDEPTTGCTRPTSKGSSPSSMGSSKPAIP
jgi:excinuclease ABC subunit A